MRKLLVAALLCSMILVGIASGALPEASANQKSTYSIGDLGPADGYIAYVDEYDEYEWDYIEISPPKWSTPVYGYGAIRMLPYGKSAESLTNLPWTVGSGPGNTEKIINTLGRGWEIERISKNSSDCRASNCKVTIELKTAHGIQSFPTGIDTPILPIMCSGKLVTVIVNSGDLTVLGPKSFVFYDNVATRNVVSDINSNTGCKITYLALAADEANIGGSTDWFLPSLDEMSLIQKSLMTKKNIFDLYGDVYASSNFKNDTTVYMWGFNYKSDTARVGARLLVDIKYSYEPIFARTFKTAQPVLTKGFPKNCPAMWDPNLLVDVKKLEAGYAAGLLTGASERDKFEIVSSWVVQKSKDAKTYQDTGVSGKLLVENAQSLVSTRMQGMAENGNYFRYSITIERKDCPKAILFSNSATLKYTDTVTWRTGNIDIYIKEHPSLFPTFKELEQLKKSIIEIREWFTSFNAGTKSACYLPDGTYGVHIFPEGHLFGCEGDLSRNQFYPVSPKLVSYDAKTIRVTPLDFTSCEVDTDNRMANPGSEWVVIDWFGKPRGISSYFVSSKTTCVIGIFLYDSWGWQWLESISLNDKSITVKEKQRIAEIKAAAELKAKQEADAKAAAEKAAADGLLTPPPTDVSCSISTAGVICSNSITITRTWNVTGSPSLDWYFALLKPAQDPNLSSNYGTRALQKKSNPGQVTDSQEFSYEKLLTFAGNNPEASVLITAIIVNGDGKFWPAVGKGTYVVLKDVKSEIDKRAAEAKAAEAKAAEAKAIVDKAAAELKAKQEAEAKAIADKAAEANRREQTISVSPFISGPIPLSASGLLIKVSSTSNLSVFAYNSTDNVCEFANGLIKTKTSGRCVIAFSQEGNSEFKPATNFILDFGIVSAAKTTTITCVKGKLTKKVTAVKPVCPAGYKKK